MMMRASKLSLFFVTAVIYLATFCFAYAHAAAQGVGFHGLTRVTAAPAHRTYLVPLGVASAAALALLLQVHVFRRLRTQLFVLGGLFLVAGVWIVTQPVALSLDLYRYLWDGHLLLHGVSPYAYVPADPHLNSLRPWRYWDLVGWKTTPDAYPPLAQVYFLISAAIRDGAIWPYRLLSLVNQCVSLVLFFLVLRRRRAQINTIRGITQETAQDTTRDTAIVTAQETGARAALSRVDVFCLGLFALFPPVLNQLVGAAHVDTFAVPWLLLAWLMYITDRPAWLGIALALATLVKLWPIVLVAAFWRWRVRRDNARLLVSLVLVLCLGYAVFAFGFAHSHVFAFYHRDIFYDDSLDDPFNHWVRTTKHAATAILALMELLIWVYVLFSRARQLPVERKVSILAFTFLLSSPMMRPWYPIPLIPFAATAGDVSVLWLALTVQGVDAMTFREFLRYLPVQYVPTYGIAIYQWFIAWPRRARLRRRP